MNQKELEAQAQKYGLAIDQIKEFRHYIKPFLRYAKKHYTELLKLNDTDLMRADEEGTCIMGLCILTNDFVNNESCKIFCNSYRLEKYLDARLKFAKPKDASNDYWYKFDRKGIQKRLDFINHQLKIVKP